MKYIIIVILLLGLTVSMGCFKRPNNLEDILNSQIKNEKFKVEHSRKAPLEVVSVNPDPISVWE